MLVRLTGLMICIPEAHLFLELAFTVALFFSREGWRSGYLAMAYGPAGVGWSMMQMGREIR